MRYENKGEVVLSARQHLTATDRNTLLGETTYSDHRQKERLLISHKNNFMNMNDFND